jgi:heme/copper-type cytochrome/quinol oxidase subunit 2
MFDQNNREEAESRSEEEIMDTFFLTVVGVVLTAFVAYVVASVRIERSARAVREKALKGVNQNMH